MAATVQAILERLEQGGRPARDDIVALLNTTEEQPLFRYADKVRERCVGNEVHLRGIIEFSNYCVKNCLYCGLRRDNSALQRYRMRPDEIVAAAAKGAVAGLKTIVLQSGEDPYYTGEALSRIIALVKEQHDVAVTMSAGDRTKHDYRLMRKAGADRYLLKHETSDPELFSRLRPGTTLGDRIKRLAWLKELGFQVGSGNMVGLPGQHVETLADDIMLMQELEVEMAGIGPFIPNNDTPLAREPAGDVAITLKSLAAARIVLRHAHLPATTALASIHPEGRQWGLNCGGNVVMPDITPVEYKKLYRIYPDKNGADQDGVLQSIPAISALITSCGRSVASSYGHGWMHEQRRM